MVSRVVFGRVLPECFAQFRRIDHLHVRRPLPDLAFEFWVDRHLHCEEQSAIIGGAEDTAAAKMQVMRECGIHVVESPAEIGETMLKVLSKKK